MVSEVDMYGILIIGMLVFGGPIVTLIRKLEIWKKYEKYIMAGMFIFALVGFAWIQWTMWNLPDHGMPKTWWDAVFLMDIIAPIMCGVTIIMWLLGSTLISISKQSDDEF